MVDEKETHSGQHCGEDEITDNQTRVDRQFQMNRSFSAVIGFFCGPGRLSGINTVYHAGRTGEESMRPMEKYFLIF
jgi:hypothetical protein